MRKPWKATNEHKFIGSYFVFLGVHSWFPKNPSTSPLAHLAMPTRQLLIALSLLITFPASAADWPQWRGPTRDGVSAETPATDWAANGPAVVWTASLGLGFSSFVIADGRLFTMGHPDDDKDCVYAFDAATGKALWEHRYAAELGDKYFPGGTTGTPSVDGSHVYTLSRWGDLFCFEAASGKVVWQKNIATETSARTPDWGFTGAPLIQGESLIVNVGAGGTALDKTTGKVLWKSSSELAAGYSTPLPYTHAGKSVIALSNEKGYYGVDAATGEQQWSLPWGTRYGVNASDPIIHGAQLFIASGYGKGSALIEPSMGEVTPLWINRELRTQMNAAVLLDGHLYGIDGDEGSKAALKCLDIATGKVLWQQPSVGFGSVSLAGGYLIVLTQKGELSIAKASSSGYDAIATAQILPGKNWTAPVLANGMLYARNGAGEMVCLDFRTAKK